MHTASVIVCMLQVLDLRVCMLQVFGYTCSTIARFPDEVTFEDLPKASYSDWQGRRCMAPWLGSARGTCPEASHASANVCRRVQCIHDIYSAVHDIYSFGVHVSLSVV